MGKNAGKPKGSGGKTVTVETGESWASIAKKVYGDERMYEELMRANKDKSMLKAGQTLVLPQKLKNPYVSKFGAEAVGMGSGAPVVAPGTNVMSPYGMWSAQNAATSGNAWSPQTQSMTPTQQAGTMPSAPKTPTPNRAGTGGTTFGGGADVMPTTKPTPITPAPTAPNMATMYAQQASGQQRPAGLNMQSAPVSLRSAKEGVKPQSTFNPSAAPAATQTTIPNVPLGQPSFAGPSFAPPQFTTTANLPLNPAQYSQQQAQYATRAGQPQPRYGQTEQGAPDSAYWNSQSVNTYAQIDAALNGVPGATPPATLNAGELRRMSFATGHSTQDLANGLINAGYVWDGASNSFVMPNQQTAAYGVPQMSGGAGGSGGGLPAYAPPVYKTPPLQGTQRRSSGGQPQPQQQAAPTTAQYFPQTQSATWRIGQ